MKKILYIAFACFLFSSCQENSDGQGMPTSRHRAGASTDYAEGKDYFLYERVRLMDKTGFTEPQEAYSVLLPKSWKWEGDIVWNQPGSSCAGTFKKLKAWSEDGNYKFEIFPDVVYSWNSDPEMMQYYSNSGGCSTKEPMDAEAYLKNIFAAELGNPEIVKIESNQSVIEQMRQTNAKAMSELQSYGAGSVDFTQTAINAVLKWSDGKEGMVTLGVTSIATTVPNVYTGSSSQIFTTQVTKKTLFTYPAAEGTEAKQQFAIILSSFRSNPAWNDAVNNFWRQARQQSNTVHVGKIRMIDERTRQIGEQAIRNGEQRLRDMDNEMRSWEQRQSSQDRVHTEFIKTIREVENFRDETGTYEMTSGYEHVWGRGDGNSFILSNNPNFDPSSVFQDQRWKPMKKVD